MVLISELDQLAAQAAQDNRALEQLISQSELFLFRWTKEYCGRVISKSDDEWSVALTALEEAVRHYQPERGGFYSFAKLVLQRRLIDFQRRCRRCAEFPVDPSSFDTESSGEDASSEEYYAHSAVLELISRQEERLSLQEEIQAANQIFALYGFSFFDLASCSPKAEKTKTACGKAVSVLLQNPDLIAELQRNRQLPLKKIESFSHLPRKILDRHRKYIIAAVELLSGEFPHLAEYLQTLKKEGV